MGTYLLFNLIFSAILGVAGVAALILAYRNYRGHKMNLVIAEELQHIILSAQSTINKSRDAMKAAGAHRAIIPGGPGVDLNDPTMLATIITTLVKKNGDLRIRMEDFDALKQGEFVSVYIDTKKQELLLSLDHSLDLETERVLAEFAKSDDSTFH